MTDSEIVNQVAVQATALAMMAFGDTDTGPWSATMSNQQEN